MKNLYPSYLINEEIKIFLEKKLLLRKTPILFIITKAFLTTNYYTLVHIQTVLRKKFMSYVKRFAKTPLLNFFFHHSNCRTYFLQTIFCQLLGSPLLCINLLVQDVNPVTLGKPNVIYQQGSRNICKLIQNLTFFNT